MSAHVGSALCLWFSEVSGRSPFRVLLCSRVVGMSGAASWHAPVRKRPWLGVAGVAFLFAPPRARERERLSSLTLRAGGFDSYCRCWRACFARAFARGFHVVRVAFLFAAGGEAGEP